MNTHRAALLAAALLWCAGGSAWAAGYLTPTTAPDMVKALPPPPAAGTGVAADDRAAFQSSRALKGQPRWDLATNDVAQTPEAAFLDFACALGVTLDDATAPTLQSMFNKVRDDHRLVTDPPKDHYARHRPYVDLGGDICVDKTEALARSASYPSGHSTLAWTWGLILAELAPDRAADVLGRARVIGESRVVCGVHYPSDIEAGRTNGAALVAALHASPEFRADMDKAREELAAARKAGSKVMPDPGQCRFEAEAAAHRPW